MLALLCRGFEIMENQTDSFFNICYNQSWIVRQATFQTNKNLGDLFSMIIACCLHGHLYSFSIEPVTASEFSSYTLDATHIS